ncbi:AI-2E family transporter [Cupriavidus pinatubonensis]|uniref:AI-2E family transporter n=1 Tax=Cupriavidus pinatubonensis TaxID=248026 RepID=UPI00112E150B|nr:AI-2E family transporter [Cupriavidus pinatubonensis]TPQ31621.1 AI-2E family transporter [Cupriavidus pinatubonensis]
MLQTSISERALSRGLLDVLIRAGLIATLVIFCFEIFHPFFDLVVWALILAVTIYPLQVRLRGRLGLSEGHIATLIVLLSIAIILVPAYLLGVAVFESVERAIDVVKDGRLSIPQPAESVASWPLVGQQLYAFWQQAATDLSGLLMKVAPQLKGFSVGLLAKLAGLGTGLLVFVFALIIAGIIMAYGEMGSRSAERIASRIVGPDRGLRIVELCTATIRAVAQGVVGIAFIQMMLIGVAFIVKDIPGAGLLALAVLLLGIMQLPATLITVPVIVYVFATEGTTFATIVFSIYVFVAGLADNVLKPLLLGRGVDVPMPVVLIGALGGMVTGGIIGLFIGPVMLAVGYRLFWLWVDEPAATVEVVTPEPTEALSPAAPPRVS